MDRLAAMEAFVRVIDTGSFSGAARHLRKGQPAVSKAVALLEEHLGVKLLMRSTHGFTATEAGLSFYERAKRTLEEADEAELAARGAGATLSGRLRISCATPFARLHVVPKLSAFLDAHPSLQMDIVMDDRNVHLIEEGIDVALRMGVQADSGLTARKIGQRPRHVVATPAYFERYGVPATPADLMSHNAIIYDQRGGGGAVWTFTKGQSQVAVTVRGRLQMTAAEGVREAVFANLGLTVTSEWMFAPELVSGRVVSVLTDWELPPIGVWAVFPTGRQANAKARAFANFIEHELAST